MSTMLKKDFLERFDIMRKLARLTTRKVAEKLEMHPSYWCDIKYRRIEPTTEEFERIMNLYSECFQYLWDEIEKMEESERIMNLYGECFQHL